MSTEAIAQTGEAFLGLMILLGAVIGLISAFGLIRLPDVYLRSHAATKSATLGVLLILTGAFLYNLLYLDHVSMKLLLGIAFVFLTSPIAGHLNGRAAHRSGVSLWKYSVRDDLKQAKQQQKEGKT